jgi:hypothetical protein
MPGWKDKNGRIIPIKEKWSMLNWQYLFDWRTYVGQNILAGAIKDLKDNKEFRPEQLLRLAEGILPEIIAKRLRNAELNYKIKNAQTPYLEEKYKAMLKSSLISELTAINVQYAKAMELERKPNVVAGERLLRELYGRMQRIDNFIRSDEISDERKMQIYDKHPEYDLYPVVKNYVGMLNKMNKDISNETDKETKQYLIENKKEILKDIMEMIGEIIK